MELSDELIHLDDWSGREIMLRESLEETDSQIYVAEIDEKAAGFIELRVFPDFVEGQPIAVVQNLVVKGNLRGRGVGSKLIERAIREAERQNAIELHVWTEFDNLHAIKFYTEHGFRKRHLLLEREI